MARRRAERILWLDSAHVSGWISRADTIEPVRCESIGWVARETGTAITLAISRNPGQWGGLIVIPKASILSRARIRG